MPEICVYHREPDWECGVSFDTFLQRFERGDAVPFDAGAVLALVDPVTVERDEGFARIETSDGEADIYGLDTTTGLMVNHASGVAVWGSARRGRPRCPSHDHAGRLRHLHR